MPTETEKLKTRWTKELQPLVGRRITEVRYMTMEERINCGFQSFGVMLILDDGTTLYPVQDDECNDVGALSIEPAPDKVGILPQLAPVI